MHLHAANRLDPFTVLSAEMPDELIQVIEKESLPQRPAALADIGDQWVIRGEAVVVRILVEYNDQLNPVHPEYASLVRDAVTVDFRFDERLK